MNLSELHNEVMSEQIAKVNLLRTGMVNIDSQPLSKADFLVYQKNNPDVSLVVEVKATDKPLKDIERNFRDDINKLLAKSTEKHYILFFIDSKKESGYFEILRNGTRGGFHKLQVDTLSTELSKYFTDLIGMEFPPYSFHDTKLTTREIYVEEKFTTLRLFNLTLSPFKKEKLSLFHLQVTVRPKNGQTKKRTFQFNKMFHNPNLKTFLFFVFDGKEYTDIELPEGDKWITFKVSAPSEFDFQMKLSCEYLTKTVNKRAWI